MRNSFYIDMDFDFDVDIDFDFEDEDDDYAGANTGRTQTEWRDAMRLKRKGAALDNLFLMDVDATSNNEWDIPSTTPFTGDLSGVEWYDFGVKNKAKNLSNTGIHFYIEDYKFTAIWNQPDRHIEFLKQCRAVITPDFSNYSDMPKVQHLWNHYRRQWLGKYWQDNGVNVVSSLSWSAGMPYGFCFAGIPQNTICATSFVCAALDKEQAIRDLIDITDVLKPYKLYIKCGVNDGKILSRYFDFERISPHTFGKNMV